MFITAISSLKCIVLTSKTNHHITVSKIKKILVFHFSTHLDAVSQTENLVDPRREIGFKNFVAFHFDEKFEASEKHF